MDKIVIALNIIVDLVDHQPNINEQDITEYLYKTGFDEYEIRQTMSLLDVNNITGAFSHRVFDEYEKRKFTVDAMFFLQKLALSGVLDMVSLEEVIIKALDVDSYKIDVEQIKQITLGHLFEKQDSTTNEESNTIGYTH